MLQTRTKVTGSGFKRRMEPLTGIEPVTSSLPKTCSTTELQRHRPRLERAAGIEPALSAWKAEALPLCNARGVVGRAGFEPA
jgi:hypothetical protein